MGEKTIYQRIGGDASMHAAVEQFYHRVLADPSLRHFFINVNMPRLQEHQLAFLSQALGGPKRYGVMSIEAAHAKLAIEQRHFDQVATHLLETLRALGIAEEIVGEAAAALAPLANQIVNTPTRVPDRAPS